MEALEHSGLGEVFHAPCDVVLDEETVVQPDIIFIKKENAPIVEEKNIQTPPDLIVEILSPASRRKDLHIKAAVYARFGVPSYWVVDPDTGSVERFRLKAGAYDSIARHTASDALTSEEFPDLRLPLNRVF